MEEWLNNNLSIVIGFIGTGAVALWRISALERRMERQSREAREDRRRIYEEQERQSRELAELRGELRGRRLIDSSDSLRSP